jgi:hypothetical protein
MESHKHTPEGNDMYKLCESSFGSAWSYIMCTEWGVLLMKQTFSPWSSVSMFWNISNNCQTSLYNVFARCPFCARMKHKVWRNTEE